MKYKPLAVVRQENEDKGWSVTYILDDGHGNIVERDEYDLPDRQAAWIKKQVA